MSQNDDKKLLLASVTSLLIWIILLCFINFL
jgi:hypothetical protein